MTVENMRSAILKVYGGQRWKDKVAFMPDHQVIAIYYNFRDRGKFEEARKKKKKKDVGIQGTQMSIFDLPECAEFTKEYRKEFRNEYHNN